VVGSVVALITDPDERGGPHVGVTDDASALALLAEPADGYSPLLAAHD
jgi:hypothetical protein